MFDGRVVAAALILVWGGFGHYHLSGSLREFQRLAPNNLMLYKVIIALKERGYRSFHMGGGLGGDGEDPLLKFKQAFSPRTRRFHIGKRIFASAEYGRLRELWSRSRPEAVAEAGNRLLFYKA
jgi:lipid II:glycine glycyltransferase (peptidoglycan interpeptide bridge formation enzyme)